MRFWLGTHRPDWLEKTDVPLFLSRRRLTGRKRLPRAQGPWALDSGGFTELSEAGRWSITPREYVQEARRYRDEIGRLTFCAPQDWMCEPAVRALTGLSVAAHQRRTTENYQELCALAPELPWIPVLQGWAPGDYLEHVEQYAKAGIPLAGLPVVGIGSVCRRQHTGEVEHVIRRLAGAGIHLHGFGFKVQGLRNVGTFLASADSMAWSFEGRRMAKAVCGGTHKNCANCLHWALTWRQRVARLAEGQTHYQPALGLEGA